ncbi:MAG: M64 family metallopeptidase [Nanoarchaeota archaeon]
MSNISINSMYVQCPDAKYVIVLSKKPFRSHVSGIGRDPNSWAVSEVAYVSMRDTRKTLPIHEFGHSFGGLRDEYYEINPALNGIPGDPNCITKAEALLKWAVWPDILADAQQEKWKGCGGICGSGCANLLRPTENSIMRYQLIEPYGTEFNAPCKKQILDRINARA